MHSGCTLPRKSEKRDLGEVDCAVEFAGVRFVPGAWLYADRNGVVVSEHRLDLDDILSTE